MSSGNQIQLYCKSTQFLSYDLVYDYFNRETLMWIEWKKCELSKREQKMESLCMHI